MKKAIEILKDATTNKPDADVERAISYLSDLTQCTEWELNPELDGLIKIKTIDGLKVEDGPYAKEFAIEQNRLDMEATNREEKKAGVVPEELPVGYGCDYAGVAASNCGLYSSEEAAQKAWEAELDDEELNK